MFLSSDVYRARTDGAALEVQESRLIEMDHA